MPYTTLITAQALMALTASARPVLLDCGFDLAQPGAGAQAHAVGHVPGARYVHLDDEHWRAWRADLVARWPAHRVEGYQRLAQRAQAKGDTHGAQAY